MTNTSSSSAMGVQFNSNSTPSLNALLTQSIDYAGLFPPCELPLGAALQNQARYVRSDHAWMLSAFVLPTGKFSAAERYFSEFDAQNPLRISALGPKAETASDFEDKLSTVLAAIRELKSANGGTVSVIQLEIALPPNCDLNLLGRLRAASGELDLRVFCEAPPSEAERTIRLLAQANAGGDSALGYKLRTGGVTADAFPGSDQIARALVAAAQKGVPIKFTAGLHHPVRQFRDEVKTKMYGFLNVLGAGVLAAEHRWDENTAVKILEDEEADSFRFEQDFFAWREWKISTDAIRSRRELVTSFGSCSFDEPREDLHSLGLL